MRGHLIQNLHYDYQIQCKMDQDLNIINSTSLHGKLGGCEHLGKHTFIAVKKKIEHIWGRWIEGNICYIKFLHCYRVSDYISQDQSGIKMMPQNIRVKQDRRARGKLRKNALTHNFSGFWPCTSFKLNLIFPQLWSIMFLRQLH